MAITQAMANSFKTEILGGIHDLDTDTLKIALYSSAATLGAGTTTYSSTNEITGAGYTAGGKAITGVVISLDGASAIVDFDNVILAGATITARGALIYNSSKSDKAIAVLDFGGDKTSTNGAFTINFPAATAGSAIIQVG